MTYPRASLVSPADTPYYHCICRCVRRAHLCGEDRLTGRSFEHRRLWMLERLRLLTEVFAIDLCAYALMGNHYHLVVRIDTARTRAWTDAEVVTRWTRLFNGPRRAHGPPSDSGPDAEHAPCADRIAQWRARLGDLSWFMRCLNERIARMANREDECTGRFWEGRFKCQALLDAGALLTAMVYVDLNPVRAGLADDLIGSDFTSVQARLFEFAKIKGERAADACLRGPRLLPFLGAQEPRAVEELPFSLPHYLELVDRSGRRDHLSKCGVIESGALPILDVLGINPDEWLATVTRPQRRFEPVVGAPERRRLFAEARGRHWYRGQRAAQRLYGTASSSSLRSALHGPG